MTEHDVIQRLEINYLDRGVKEVSSRTLLPDKYHKRDFVTMTKALDKLVAQGKLTCANRFWCFVCHQTSPVLALPSQCPLCHEEITPLQVEFFEGSYQTEYSIQDSYLIEMGERRVLDTLVSNLQTYQPGRYADLQETAWERGRTLQEHLKMLLFSGGHAGCFPARYSY